MKFPKAVCLIVYLVCSIAPAIGQDLPQDFRNKLDAIVAEAYDASTAEFPCSLKTRGKPKMLRWQDVDQCLNDAASRVDWDGLAQKLRDLRRSVPGYMSAQVDEFMEESFSAKSLPYEKAFKVKDTDALLPLTNSVLKFIPPNALQDLPVYDKAGARIGAFAGTYSFERRGGSDSTGAYKLTLFQYVDLKGEIQSSSDRILLDSFGVPWADASKKPGFCLEVDRLLGQK
jgi:hypothetical protein